jgi:adenylate cyclase
MTKNIAAPIRSIFLRFHNFFSKSSNDEMIGEVLVKKGVITEGELQEAMEAQKEKLFVLGKAVPLGQIIVELGGSTESTIVHAVNEHYNISISSLSDNIKDLVRKIRGTLTEDFPTPRIPIWLQLSIATMFILAVSIGVLSYVIMERQRDTLYDHTVKLGMVSLNYFGNNAKIPLLTDDILELNTLINNAATVEGHFYAFIVDNNQVIKAHTDHEKIDSIFEPFQNVEKTFQKGAVTYFNYTLPEETHVLNLSMPILFKEKKLGEVHVGLSIDFIRKLFLNERSFLVYSTLVIILLGMVAAVLFSLRFSRPVSALLHATSQIAKGRYDFKVDLNRNDELGTLGDAFNRMGTELYRQSLMKETFGKYVGSEVLDMIMSSPGKSWLKGRKNEASILFADIRGFTAYSEAKEPEVIVEKLNEFFEIATKVILDHGGYIDKFIGDSVLGVFGVPVYQRDHTERCIRAAVDMQRELSKAAQDNNTLLSAVGIGITSGVVVAGNIGSQVKMEYTVIGDTVNVASHLNNLAGAGEIIVGSSVGKDFGHIIDVETLEPQKIKGRGELVEVFRVLRLKDRK